MGVPVTNFFQVLQELGREEGLTRALWLLSHTRTEYQTVLFAKCGAPWSSLETTVFVPGAKSTRTCSIIHTAIQETEGEGLSFLCSSTNC